MKYRHLSYRKMSLILGVPFCAGGCGIDERRHRAGTLFMGVIHWSERRFSRRGARNFLLLAARREREADPEFLNAPHLRFYHVWWDAQRAAELAATLHFRFPAEASLRDRARCYQLARQQRVRLIPRIRRWALAPTDRRLIDARP
jgi:hypothetical protein